jgi:hypothetical protein
MEDYRDHTPATAPLVRVDWEDICFADSWNDSEADSLQPVEASTVGWLLYEDETRIIIASSYNWREETWGTVHTLPKSPPTVMHKGGRE